MIDFAKICRLCVSDNNTLINVLTLDDDSVTLCDKLKTVCDIQVNANDTLPTTICVLCQEKLRQFYEFKLMCLHSNVLLNRYKKDLPAATQFVGDFRDKYSNAFGSIDIKQEVDKPNDTELSENSPKDNSFTATVGEGTQNAIPLRKTRKEVNETFVEDEQSHAYNDFTETSLELNVDEVEEVLINWGKNKTDTSVGSGSEADIKSQTEPKPTTFKNIIDSKEDLTQDNDEESSSQDAESDSKDEDYKPDEDSCDIGETKVSLADTVSVVDSETDSRGTYSCHECDKTYTSTRGLENHVTAHVEARTDYSCSRCSNTFTSASGLRLHIMRYSGSRPYSCKICGKRFTDRPNLYNHRRVHSTDRPYQCETCGKRFKFASCKRTHMKYHEERTFLCSICGKAFALKITLQNHLRIHSGERPFKCSICSASFADPSSLKSHAVKHTQGKPFQCELCLQDFKWEKSLKSHRKLHSRTEEERRERRFSCEICGKQFRTKDSLVKHGAVHSDARPWSCDLCGKTFKFQSCWRTHKKHHEGNRVVCTICGKKYLNNSVLNNHMRLHTGEKPFKCSLCDKAFADNSTLRSHKIAHSNIKSQRCQYCGLEFKHRSYLMFHCKKKHLDEMQQEQSTEQMENVEMQ